MKPILLNRMKTIDSVVQTNNIPLYASADGFTLKDSGVALEELEKVANIYNDTVAHIKNASIHVTQDEKDNWNSIYEIAESHVINNAAHITNTDREIWNAKETPDGAQLKANIVQSNLNLHINNTLVHVTQTDKSKWNNTYTKEEIDNKFATLENNIDWKEAVDTFSDLDIVYPAPYAGWTVNVIDTNITYRFNGVEWTAISANSIPNATEDIDGLMTAAMVKKLNTIEENANNYSHPLYQINDDGEEEMIWHVTNDQAEFWNNKAENVLATFNSNGLMSKEDRYKLAYIQDNATCYIEPEFFPPTKIQEDEDHMFVTQEQINYWNAKASNNIAVAGILDGLMSSDDKAKLNSVQYNANYYVHPSQHQATIIVTDEEHRFVTDADKIAWNNKATTSVVTSTENGLMAYQDKCKIDTVEMYANNYSHPEYHLPSIIKQDKSNRFVSDAQIQSWTMKKDADKVLCGTGIFNSTDGTFVGHDIGHTTYSVSIVPTEEPIDVGNIWIRKENDYFVVMCSGESTTVPFDWILIVQ